MGRRRRVAIAIMHSSPPAVDGSSGSFLQVSELFGLEVPLPVLQRGWLHCRQLILPWDPVRIVDKLGEGCWFSHHARSKSDADVGAHLMEQQPKLRPFVVAGFWPGGGFVELRCSGNPLEDNPRGTLTVYAESGEAADALLSELFAGYRQPPSEGARQPRIGLLNYSYESLSVERIAITAQQIVPRDRVDLYYGDGTNEWIDAWVATLNARRYGLTVITGAPGTGKTTLIRSIAHWLAETHVFYFMPAARFTSVESGEIVTFWADENRNSKLRKVLILEDAESVLLRRGDDNREKVATLLNLTDGMLGDALGLHVVCTLNSHLTDMDPALLRPGRLVAHREFDLLTAEEARRLAVALNLPAPATERISLAELLNGPIEEKSAQVPALTGASRRAMGFHTLLPQT